MESCWIFKMKNGTKLHVSEEQYNNHKFMLTGDIEVEEHWFNTNKAKEQYGI